MHGNKVGSPSYMRDIAFDKLQCDTSTASALPLTNFMLQTRCNLREWTTCIEFKSQLPISSSLTLVPTQWLSPYLPKVRNCTTLHEIKRGKSLILLRGTFIPWGL